MRFIYRRQVMIAICQWGTQREKTGKRHYDTVFSFLISFCGLLKGHLYELTSFHLFG